MYRLCHERGGGKLNRQGSLLLAGCGIILIALLPGCAIRNAPAASASASAATANSKALPPLCPQAAANVAPPTPCVSAGVQQYQQSNQMFNERETLPGWLAAEAAPVTARIRQSLQRLGPAQRLQVAAVKSALLAAGMWSSDLVVDPGQDGVLFGGYEPFNTRPAVCAYGDVTPKTVVLDIGGNTLEGACLPSPGGH
jgi:hypothetical protein